MNKTEDDEKADLQSLTDEEIEAIGSKFSAELTRVCTKLTVGCL